MLVSKFDDDIVFSRGSGKVGHGAGSIFVIDTLDLRLRRSLYGEGQTAGASILGYNGEVAGLCSNAMAQTGAIGSHIASADRVHVELEWRAVDWLLVVEHLEGVQADLGGLVADGDRTIAVVLDLGEVTATRGCGDHSCVRRGTVNIMLNVDHMWSKHPGSPIASKLRAFTVMF